ncbi:MAG: Flp family type IVb pilin [Candidatus Thorarchaeota archaeon]
MKRKIPFRKYYNIIKSDLRRFFTDESGGNLVEYALLIGLALFIFFIIVGIITSLLDWTMSQTNSLFEGFII